MTGENNPAKKDEIRKRISKSRLGKYTGSNNPNWRGGGIDKKLYCEKWTPEFRNRIRAFFDYECILCGKSQEDNNEALSCHHVYYNKSACCDGTPVCFAALCKSCHGKTGCDKDRWQKMIHRIIDEIYDGKSYYTKEEYIYLNMCWVVMNTTSYLILLF